MPQQPRLRLGDGKFSRHPAQEVFFQRDVEQVFNLLPGTPIRFAPLRVVDCECILQFLYKCHRIAKTDIGIECRPSGQDFVGFHPVLTRVQQGHDVRIGGIFPQGISFHLHPFVVGIEIESGKIHGIAEHIDVLVSGSQINIQELGQACIIDKNADKSFAGHPFFGFDKRMIETDFGLVA